MQFYSDHIVDPWIDAAWGDPALLWTIIGIVAGVAAITAAVIVILVKKKKKEGR